MIPSVVGVQNWYTVANGGYSRLPYAYVQCLPKERTVLQILRTLLLRLELARDIDDVNIAAGETRQELDELLQKSAHVSTKSPELSENLH